MGSQTLSAKREESVASVPAGCGLWHPPWALVLGEAGQCPEDSFCSCACESEGAVETLEVWRTLDGASEERCYRQHRRPAASCATGMHLLRSAGLHSLPDFLRWCPRTKALACWTLGLLWSRSFVPSCLQLWNKCLPCVLVCWKCLTSSIQGLAPKHWSHISEVA